MITVRYSASVSRVLIILGNPKGGRRKAWPSNEVTLPPSSNQRTWVRGPCSSQWRAGHSMNLAVWSNRSSSASLCSCKNSLTSYKSVRHCHCLQSIWCSIRESIIMPSKNSVPVYLPCSKELPESPGQGPQMLHFSSVWAGKAHAKEEGTMSLYSQRSEVQQSSVLQERVQEEFICWNGKWGNENFWKTNNRMRNRNSCIKLSLKENNQSYIQKNQNSQGLGKYFATKATPGLYHSCPH